MLVKGWNKKKTQILMKDHEQKTVHSFFITTVWKEQWDLLENKNKIKTINTEIDIKNFLSKFGKQTIINYQISNQAL